MTQTTETPAPKKKSRKLIGIVAGALILVLVAAGAAIALRARGAAVPADASADAHKASGPAGLLSLDPFVVNLADQGASRFLRVSIRLIVGSPEHAERLQKNDVTLMRVRSAILDLLTEQTADRLVTADGKTALRQAIAARVEPVLDDTKVTDVLFSDFVVQF